MGKTNTTTKTLIQYSRPLPEETAEFLKSIALDYSKVKNYVYQRYSGIKSVNRLTPVYSILNEMRYCGLRAQLEFPAVYYELAVSDAVTDIKVMWALLKNKLNDLVNDNENLSASDRIYIRTVLKINSVFSAVLNREKYTMPNMAKDLDIDADRLNNLICRLVRKHLTTPKTDHADTFRVTPGGYRYKDGGIYLVSRIPRKRVFVPLMDGRIFNRQILIKTDGCQAQLFIPVEAKIKAHAEYKNTVCIHIGNRDMFTLSNGNIYGEGLEKLVYPETLRLDKKNQARNQVRKTLEKYMDEDDFSKAANIQKNNLGKKKYDSQKAREREKTKNFINAEINRMLKAEKPAKIVITKPVTKNRTKHRARQTNLKLARSFNGYIRERLEFKCKVNAVELIEINSKGTGSVCSACGGDGIRQGAEFTCRDCGLKTTIALNSAKNIKTIYEDSFTRPENKLPNG